MRSGVICGRYGGKSCRKGSGSYEGSIYHRVTRISDCEKVELSDLERQELRGMSTKRSWVAVQGDKSIFFATRDIALEKPDFSKIFPSGKPMAAVSMFLGSNEVNDGSGIAVSFAKFKEKVAIKYLEKVFEPGLIFTDEEARKAATVAHLYLVKDNINVKDNIKANDRDLKIYVKEKSYEITRSFIRSKLDAYFRKCGRSDSISPVGRGSSDYKSRARMTSVTDPPVDVDVGCESMETSTEKSKSKIVCNRETYICCGGWDSQLLKSSGFSWIAVQGKDYICVVTQDEVTLGDGFFRNVLYHLKDNQMFRFKSFVNQSAKESSMISPFAAVSVLVGEYGDIDRKVSIAEYNAIEFLMKKIKKDSDFTYEATVQTAISALLFLAAEELSPEDIKVFVLRNGEDISIRSAILTTEIEEHLRALLAAEKEYFCLGERPRLLMTMKEHLPVIKRLRI